MNEQGVRALVNRWATGVDQRRDAAQRCTYSDAALVNDGWAAGLEEAVVGLVELLDGAKAARDFRERLTGGPGRNIEGVTL
ncbi:hypothetical protein [Streptomyces decoyicus]